MKLLGKFILGIIIILFILGVMTVLKENTGRLTGGTGILGSIILFGLIAFGFSLVSSKEPGNAPKGHPLPPDSEPTPEPTPEPAPDPEISSNEAGLRKLLEEGIISMEEYIEKSSVLKEKNKKDITSSFRKLKSLEEFNLLVSVESTDKINELQKLKEQGIFSSIEYAEKLNTINNIAIKSCLINHGIKVLLDNEIRTIRIGHKLRRKNYKIEMMGEPLSRFEGYVAWVNPLKLDNVIVFSTGSGQYYKWKTASCTVIEHDPYFKSTIDAKDYNADWIIHEE